MVNDFYAIQKELLDKKVLIHNNGLQRNTTWKKFDISSYGVPEREFWFRVLNPDAECKCAFCGATLNFETCYVSSKNELFCSKKEAYEKAKEKRKQTNLTRFGSECALNNEEKRQKCKETWAKKDTHKIIEKRESTILEKYGSKENFYLKNFSKIKKTNSERYGSESPLGNSKVREKVRNTCLKKYGSENVFSSEEVKEKIKATCLKKYGVDSIAKVPEVRAKQRKSLNEKLNKFAQENSLTSVKDLTFEFGTGWLQANVVKEIKFNGAAFVNNSDIPAIKSYYENSVPKGTSQQENELKDFVKSLSLDAVFNDRTVLDGELIPA